MKEQNDNMCVRAHPRVQTSAQAPDTRSSGAAWCFAAIACWCGAGAAAERLQMRNIHCAVILICGVGMGNRCACDVQLW